MANWINRLRPGSGYRYNEPEMTYNEQFFEGKNVLYTSLTEITSWLNRFKN